RASLLSVSVPPPSLGEDEQAARTTARATVVDVTTIRFMGMAPSRSPGGPLSKGRTDRGSAAICGESCESRRVVLPRARRLSLRGRHRSALAAPVGRLAIAALRAHALEHAIEARTRDPRELRGARDDAAGAGEDTRHVHLLELIDRPPPRFVER